MSLQIINNDVCAYIQSQLGVHQLLPDVPEGRTVAGFQGPLTKWSKNVTAALEIHSMFLNCPGSFRVGSNVTQVAWYSRVSINMMAMTWRTARRAFRAMLLAHRFVPFFEDEGFLTGSYVNTQLKGHSIPHYIVPGFTVSHFAFKKQRVDESDAALASQLAQYREVSKITSCLH